MSRRRKRRRKVDAPDVPDRSAELSGIQLLLSESPADVLDLHGLTRIRARRRSQDFLATHARTAAGAVVHIITGKGVNSEGDAVLLGLVRDMLTDDVANEVAEFAGMLGGGGWVVRLR